jgi:hypothetical protein
MPLEEALAELDTLGSDDTLSYQSLAKKMVVAAQL